MKKVPKGYAYVPKRSPSKPYYVSLSINGKSESVGFFATEAEATAAYLAKRAEHPPMNAGPKKGEPRIGGYKQ